MNFQFKLTDLFYVFYIYIGYKNCLLIKSVFKISSINFRFFLFNDYILKLLLIKVQYFHLSIYKLLSINWNMHLLKLQILLLRFIKSFNFFKEYFQWFKKKKKGIEIKKRKFYCFTRQYTYINENSKEFYIYICIYIREEEKHNKMIIIIIIIIKRNYYLEC